MVECRDASPVNSDGSPFTIIDYAMVLQHAGGKCKLCGTHPDAGTRLYISYDRKTDKVRGLICLNCNDMMKRIFTSGLPYKRRPRRTLRRGYE